MCTTGRTGLQVIGMALGIALGLGAGAATGCAPRAGTVKHNLPPTGGEVRFAPSRDAWYGEKWQQGAKATQPMICAGFVHHRSFGHYQKFGKFELEMVLEVVLGGEPEKTGEKVTGWRGGKLLRTITKQKAIGETNNSYVWCGRLQKGGAWKVGAMRYAFTLRGPERAMDEPVARGVLPIAP